MQAVSRPVSSNVSGSRRLEPAQSLGCSATCCRPGWVQVRWTPSAASYLQCIPACTQGHGYIKIVAITDRLSNAMNIQRAGGGCHRLDLALVQLAGALPRRLGRIHDTVPSSLLPAANQMLCFQTPAKFCFATELQFCQLTLWSCE